MLHEQHPELNDPQAAIVAGRVRVDGFPVANPRSMVRPDARIEVIADRELRGEAKLRAALVAFLGYRPDEPTHQPLAGCVAVDVGAAAGGFTRVLLRAGASKVYAVDAGHGQLLGSLRADPRVVNLEATNLGDLDLALVPDPIDVVTMDLSYLALADAVPQLDAIRLCVGTQLFGLVKPMFELGLPSPPTEDRLAEAARHACLGIEAAGWSVCGTMRSPVTGAGGAVEFVVRAKRRG